MAYAKAWRLTTTKLQELIDAADLQGNCYVEVYSATTDSIDDCQLYLKLSNAWENDIPIDPPVIPPIA